MLVLGVAHAQTYPAKPVRIIVPYPPGGGTRRRDSRRMEAVGGTPEEFAAFMRAETAKWAKVVKTANIKPE